MNILKIENIHLNNLQNDEHFQFVRNVLTLVDNAGIEQRTNRSGGAITGTLSVTASEIVVRSRSKIYARYCSSFS